MRNFFVVLITGAVMSWMWAQARKAKARRIGKAWLFAPVPALLAVYSLVLAMGLAFVFFGFRGPQGDRAIVVAAGVLFVVFPVVTWFKAVELSDAGLRQRNWLGMWKILAWSAVCEIKQKQSGYIVVCGKHCKIVFSIYHAGVKLFVRELHRHAPTLRIVPTTDL